MAGLIVECRLVDDLPPALVAEPATHRLTAFPRVPASLRYRVKPQERGDWETGWLYVRYRSGLGLAERWARAPLTQTVRVYPGAAHRRRAADLPRPQPPDRPATAPRAAARAGPRLREPARVPRGRRPARHLLDGHGAARQPHHPPVPDRAQPAGVDRARLRAADALAGRASQAWQTVAADAQPSAPRSCTPSSTTPAPPPSRWRNWRSSPATASACWLMGRAFSSGCCPGAARHICAS